MGAAAWREGEAAMRTATKSPGPGHSAALPFTKVESGVLLGTQGPQIVPSHTVTYFLDLFSWWWSVAPDLVPFSRFRHQACSVGDRRYTED